MTLTFSVVTPTRNNLDKLKKCIGSVRGQREVQVEHIIQDACSTDGTADWLKQQRGLASRSEPDSGMYDAINRGWQRSNGDVISWLNSDEQYLRGSLKIVEEVFVKNPSVDFVYGNFVVVDNEGEPIAARREIRLSRIYISNGFLNAASCTLFFRRKLFEEGLLQLDESYKYAADMDLILRLLATGKKVLHIPFYLALFTLDGTNLSCSPKMLVETHEVQQKYGGLGNPILRKFISLGRYLERLITGSYLTDTVTFDYALDEIPNYKQIHKDLVPPSYETRSSE